MTYVEAPKVRNQQVKMTFRIISSKNRNLGRSSKYFNTINTRPLTPGVYSPVHVIIPRFRAEVDRRWLGQGGTLWAGQGPEGDLPT